MARQNKTTMEVDKKMDKKTNTKKHAESEILAVVQEYIDEEGEYAKDFCVVTKCQQCGNLQKDGTATADETTWNSNEGYSYECYSCGEDSMKIETIRSTYEVKFSAENIKENCWTMEKDVISEISKKLEEEGIDERKVFNDNSKTDRNLWYCIYPNCIITDEGYTDALDQLMTNIREHLKQEEEDDDNNKKDAVLATIKGFADQCRQQTARFIPAGLQRTKSTKTSKEMSETKTWR